MNFESFFLGFSIGDSSQRPQQGHRRPQQGHRRPQQGHRRPQQGHRRPQQGHGRERCRQEINVIVRACVVLQPL